MGCILFWEGRVSRGRLISEYGLSPIRASEWLRDFCESSSEWVAWDSKLKADVATSLAYADAEHAVNASRPSAVSTMLVPHAVSAPGKLLSVSWDFAPTSPRTFSWFNLALTDRVRVSFLCCSMSNPEPHEPQPFAAIGRQKRMLQRSLNTRRKLQGRPPEPHGAGPHGGDERGEAGAPGPSAGR